MVEHDCSAVQNITEADETDSHDAISSIKAMTPSLRLDVQVSAVFGRLEHYGVMERGGVFF
jgi:RNA-binding protein YlmH